MLLLLGDEEPRWLRTSGTWNVGKRRHCGR